MKKYFEYMKKKTGSLDVWSSFYHTVSSACEIQVGNWEKAYDLEAMVEFFRDAVSENGSKVDMIKSFRFGNQGYELAGKILELFPSNSSKGIEDLNLLFKEIFEEDSSFARDVVQNFMFQKIDDVVGSNTYNQVCNFKAQMFVDYLNVTSDNDRGFIFKSQPQVIEKVKELGVLLVKPPAFKTLLDEISQQPLERVVKNPGIIASRVLNSNTEELLETVKSGNVYTKGNIPVLALLLRKDHSQEFYQSVKMVGGKEIIEATISAVSKESRERNSAPIDLLRSSEYIWQDVMEDILQKNPSDLVYSSGYKNIVFSNMPLSSNVENIENNIRLMSTYIFGSDDYKNDGTLSGGKIGKTLEFVSVYLNAVFKVAHENFDNKPEVVSNLVSGLLNNDYCRDLVTLGWGENLSHLGMAGVMLERVGAENFKSDLFLAANNNQTQNTLVNFFVLADKVKNHLSSDDIEKLENVRLSMVENIWTQRTKTYRSNDKEVKNIYECKSPSMYAISISDVTIPKIQEVLKARNKSQMDSLFEAVDWVKNFADDSSSWGGFGITREAPVNGREMMLKLMLSDPETTDKFKEGKSTVIKHMLLKNQESFLSLIRETEELVPLLEKNKEVQRNIALFNPGLSEKAFAVFLEHNILKKASKNKDKNKELDFADSHKL